MPTAIVSEEQAPPAVMEEVVERLDHAMVKVVANRGAPGPDGVTVGMLREQWPTIANVVDRVVMEAVRQVLEPQFEPTFHASSHGFRPGRSCHSAIAEAKKHVPGVRVGGRHRSGEVL